MITNKAVVTMLFILCSALLHGQNKLTENDYAKKAKIILLDSLIINDSAFYCLNINFIDATKIEVIPVKIYKLNQNALTYKGENDFSKYILLEENRIEGFLLLNSKPIGYIQGYLINNRWMLFSCEKFQGDNPKQVLFNRLENKLSVFSIKSIGGIWCQDLHGTVVYSFFSNQFMSVKEYIFNTIGMDGIKEALKNDGLFP